MKTVTFKSKYDHITPTRTVAYPDGYTGEVSNETAEAASAKGKLENEDGGRPNPRRAKGDTGSAEG